VPDLTITDLTVEYISGGMPIRPVDELNLRFEAGSLVLLLGPSGCGKTTLLSCIGSILSPSSGSIRFGDTEITSLTGQALTEFRRETIGIVFQAFNLVESLTALENVALPIRAAGQPWSQAKERATQLLEQFDLGDRMDHRPGGLSGGQQQRVALARALALDPGLILADEPTAHLDYIQVESLLQHVRSLASGERVVIVATHDHRLVPLADQVVELVPDLGHTDLPPEAVTLAVDEILFAQGSWGSRIYVVEDGEIEIVKQPASGPEVVIATVSPGQFFGEMGPLYNLPRTASARARVPARVTGYSVREFRQRIGSDALDGRSAGPVAAPSAGH
jgi:putative ABC transport system ATP-binding protein